MEGRAKAGDTRRLGYVPAFDGIRAVAVAVIVLLHVWEWPGGGLQGVDLFFVLSGFLISVLLMEEWGSSATISLRAFYARRVLRLMPALVALVLAYVLFVVVRLFAGRHLGLSPAERDNLLGALLGPLYLENILVSMGSPLSGELRHLWTLATEEQFYLLWPPALLWLLRRRPSLREIQGVLTVAIVAVAGWRLFLSFQQLPIQRLFTGPDTRFDSILIGCWFGLAFLRRQTGSPARRVPRWLFASSAAFVCVVLLAPDRWTTGPGPVFLERGGYDIFAAACGIVVFAIATDDGGLVARCLSVTPLVWLGRLSYSLYLWHFLVVLVAQHFTFAYLGETSFVEQAGFGIAEIALSVVVAAASYRYVEQPFLKAKARFERSASQAEANADRLTLAPQETPVATLVT